MKKSLLINPEKCTGCRTCELMCSLEHDSEFNPNLARITMVNFPEEIETIPITCLHCAEPSCQEACPTGAIERIEETGAVVIQHDKCIGCNMCMMACPIGIISTEETETSAHNSKCDLCGGEPECVEFCPTGALEYGRPDDILLDRKKKLAKKLDNLIEEAI